MSFAQVGTKDPGRMGALCFVLVEGCRVGQIERCLKSKRKKPHVQPMPYLSVVASSVRQRVIVASAESASVESTMVRDEHTSLCVQDSSTDADRAMRRSCMCPDGIGEILANQAD